MDEDRKYTYRVRPCNSFTLDELRRGYIWFSRPTCYNDTEDANIAAFINDTDAIERGLLYAGYRKECIDKYVNEMSHIGICCFTKEMPSGAKLACFPECKRNNAIVIKYNRDKLKEFFETHRVHPLYPCFHDVIYDKVPTKLDKFDEWSFLVGKDELGNRLYKTIPGILHEHPRELDKLIFILYTRIKSRFENQKEERIIIAGRNIPKHNNETTGYQIQIPIEVIDTVYVYSSVTEDFREELNEILSIANKIVSLPVGGIKTLTECTVHSP